MPLKKFAILIALAALVGGSAQAGPRGGRSAGSDGRSAGGGGTVASVDIAAQSFVVQAHGAAVTVTTTSSTVFQKSDGSAATQVLILGGAGSGTVVSVDSASLSVVVQPKDGTSANITVTTSSSTVFQKSDGSTAAFSHVAVGSRVLVQSTVTGTNTVAATRVLILAANGTCAPSAGSGTVVSADSTALSFVVNARGAQVTVTTSSATVFQKSDGSAAAFADVVAGAKVAVQGAVTGTSTVDATKVIIVVSSSGSSSGRRRR